MLKKVLLMRMALPNDIPTPLQGSLEIEIKDSLRNPLLSFPEKLQHDASLKKRFLELSQKAFFGIHLVLLNLALIPL